MQNNVVWLVLLIPHVFGLDQIFIVLAKHSNPIAKESSHNNLTLKAPEKLYFYVPKEIQSLT